MARIFLLRLKKREKGGSLRGASTISQQVAKNLFLWQGRSFIRKGLEAYFTVMLEILWPKRRILEVYLNIAEFGDGIYGVEAAAKRFFNKPPSRLTERESALLSAVLPNPIRLKVAEPSAYVTRRAQRIERQMRNLGSSYLKDIWRASWWKAAATPWQPTEATCPAICSAPSSGNSPLTLCQQSQILRTSYNIKAKYIIRNSIINFIDFCIP